MLRGSTPQKTAKRLKALVFGASGVGKTMLAIQFPKPYLIDTERGSVNDHYVDAIREREGVVFSTTSFDDIVKEVNALRSTEHDFKTLIIDPVTVIYETMLATWERRVGSDFGKHYGAARKEWRRLEALLTLLDMNVVMTAHQKLQYADDGSFNITGKTYDGAKGMDYWVDLELEAYKKGDERLARVSKSRIAGLDEGEVIPLSYSHIAKIYGGNLEGAASVSALATYDQVEAIRIFLDSRSDGDLLLTRWLQKAEVEQIEDLTEVQAKGCLRWIEAQQ